MQQNAPNCTKMHQNAPNYTKMTTFWLKIFKMSYQMLVYCCFDLRFVSGRSELYYERALIACYFFVNFQMVSQHLSSNSIRAMHGSSSAVRANLTMQGEFPPQTGMDGSAVMPRMLLAQRRVGLREKKY